MNNLWQLFWKAKIFFNILFYVLCNVHLWAQQKTSIFGPFSVEGQLRFWWLMTKRILDDVDSFLIDKFRYLSNLNLLCCWGTISRIQGCTGFLLKRGLTMRLSLVVILYSGAPTIILGKLLCVFYCPVNSCMPSVWQDIVSRRRKLYSILTLMVKYISSHRTSCVTKDIEIYSSVAFISNLKCLWLFTGTLTYILYM